MRQAAVIAAAYFEWPDAVSLLDALIARETDAQILADAKLVRSRFRLADEQPITGFDRLDVPVGEHKDTVWALRESDGTYRIASIP